MNALAAAREHLSASPSELASLLGLSTPEYLELEASAAAMPEAVASRLTSLLQRPAAARHLIEQTGTAAVDGRVVSVPATGVARILLALRRPAVFAVFFSMVGSIALRAASIPFPFALPIAVAMGILVGFGRHERKGWDTYRPACWACETDLGFWDLLTETSRCPVCEARLLWD